MKKKGKLIARILEYNLSFFEVKQEEARHFLEISCLFQENARKMSNGPEIEFF